MPHPRTNSSRDFFIVLLSFLPTVANARAAARRDIEEYFVLETMVAVNIFARAAAPLGPKLVDPSYHSPGGRATRLSPRRALLGARGGDGARRHVLLANTCGRPALSRRGLFASHEIRSSSKFLRFLDQVTRPK